MNWKRGLFRVWAILSVVWMAGWIFHIGHSCQRVLWPGTSDEYHLMCHTDFGEWLKRYDTFTIWDYGSILIYGVSVPLSALAIGAAICWAKNGFKISPTPPTAK